MSWTLEGYFPACGPAEVHIFPADEQILHNLEGEFCFCTPRVEELPKANLIVHNSTDTVGTTSTSSHKGA
jgi:hypothetical protein